MGDGMRRARAHARATRGRPPVDPAALGFDDPAESWSSRRRGSTRDDGREARSFPHTHGGEGKNYVD